MPDEAEGSVEAAPVDVKSRIAAFSQVSTGGGASAGPSTSPAKQRLQQGPTPARPSKPPAIGGKKPSTAQLLPPWQQNRGELQDFLREDSKPLSCGTQDPLARSSKSVDDVVPATTSKGEDDDSSNTMTKARVKDIIALYGQPRDGPKLSEVVAPTLEAVPRIAKTESTAKKQAEGTSSSNRVGAPSTSKAEVPDKSTAPPPVLPPRPKPTTLLSQSNTGSSGTSSSSAGGHSAGGQRMGAASPQSTYTPYVRKGSLVNENQSIATRNSAAEIPDKGSAVPALPPRSWAARSTDDLSLSTPPNLSSSSSNSTAAANVNANARRMLGSGPMWASSSSGNLTAAAAAASSNSNTNGGHTTPPMVPPRGGPPITSTHSFASSSSNLTPSGGTLIPPPPKRGITSNVSPLSSPKVDRTMRRPTSAALRSTPTTNTTTKAAPSDLSHLGAEAAYRNSISSARASPTQPIASAMTAVAPPPRHVDARRAGTAMPYTTSSSTQQAAAARRARKQERRAQREKRYAQEAVAGSAAEQRYSTLFDQQWRVQQRKSSDRGTNPVGGDDGMIPMLNRRTIARLWKRSLLEDWFLAKVWTAASNAENTGVSKAAFIRAMNAIDAELARRQGIRESR